MGCVDRDGRLCSRGTQKFKSSWNSTQGRHNDPPGFLADIRAVGFPLRFIDYDAQAKPITTERLLTEHVGEDWMLYLCR